MNSLFNFLSIVVILMGIVILFLVVFVVSVPLWVGVGIVILVAVVWSVCIRAFKYARSFKPKMKLSEE